MLWLYLLLALLLQTICAISFASASYTHQNNFIKKAVLVCGVLTFLGTVTVYALMWVNHLWLIPDEPLKPIEMPAFIWANITWILVTHLILWSWSLAMFTGAVILASSHITAGKIIIEKNSILDRVIKLSQVEISDQTNICNLSWKLAFMIAVIPLLTFMFLLIFSVMSLIGVVAFIIAGKNPLIFLSGILPIDAPSLRTYRVKGVPVIPIIPLGIGFIVWLGFKLPPVHFVFFLITLAVMTLVIFLIIIGIKAWVKHAERSAYVKMERRRQKILEEINSPTIKARPSRPIRPVKVPRPNIFVLFWQIIKGKACLQVSYDQSSN